MVKMNQTFEKKISEFPRTIFRYVPIDENNLKALEERYIWCSQPEKFDDPFDSVFYFDGNFSESYIKSMLRLSGVPEMYLDSFYKYYLDHPETRKIVTEGLQYSLSSNFAKRVRVCCFSELQDEILMWSHYADFHRGMCLEFDVKRLVFNGGKDLIPIFKINYSPNVVQTNFEKEQSIAGINAYTNKFDRWDYEKEYRAIITRPESKVHFDPGALVSVTFGCSTPLEKKEEVRAKLGDSVAYFRYVMEGSSYELKKEQEDFIDYGFRHHEKWRKKMEGLHY